MVFNYDVRRIWRSDDLVLGWLKTRTLSAAVNRLDRRVVLNAQTALKVHSHGTRGTTSGVNNLYSPFRRSGNEVSRGETMLCPPMVVQRCLKDRTVTALTKHVYT